MNTNTLTKEKIAIILEPHVQHLADMKARGKPLSELLYWIRSTHGWVLNPAQLERFLKQKESAAQPQANSATPSSVHCQTPPLSAIAHSATADCRAIASATAEVALTQSVAPTQSPAPSSQPCKNPP